MMKMEATDRRFIRRLPSEGRASISLQRMLAETKRASQNTNDQIPDLINFMNDMFLGVVSDSDRKKAYNLSGDRDEYDFDSSTRSVSSRHTQEWLEEAKRMVALSPLRGSDSPSRLGGSPRFGTSQGRFSTSSLDKRDPFSRSARRHRAAEGFSGEILTKTAMHAQNKSLTNLDSPQDTASPASDIQKWVSNILKIPNSPDPTISPDPTPPSPTNNLGGPPLPPRQSTHRRSRFQSEPNTPLSHSIPISTNSPAISLPKTSNSNNGPSTTLDTQLLSPPKNLIESAHRRSISSTTCFVPDGGALSPPRNLVESAHRRSISSSTCRTDRILQKDVMDDGKLKHADFKGQDLNGFLKEQRIKIEKLLSGEINGKAKIVLSGPSNS
ncbi:hypothetical protein CDL12_00874 [Handroanthus impetiginosus]|uniref:Uncharacterized protein n=1 Tax=Handroanthus impetiginosus TaxID=429701 RepID=A0A2G9I9C9_9LAMI|nr:hypothetical protein CDL12_00874 [Handroanthus impetiginosus]